MRRSNLISWFKNYEWVYLDDNGVVQPMVTIPTTLQQVDPFRDTLKETCNLAEQLLSASKTLSKLRREKRCSRKELLRLSQFIPITIVLCNLILVEIIEGTITMKRLEWV